MSMHTDPPPPPPIRGGERFHVPPPPPPNLAFIDVMGQWLHCSVRAQLELSADLLSQEERQIPSTRNATAEFNLLENLGDVMVTVGRGRDVLVALCNEAGWPERLANRLAQAIVANVEFGPVFTAMLDLSGFFCARTEAEINSEVVAGLFECVLGALERGGRTLLVNAILRWCASVLR